MSEMLSLEPTHLKEEEEDEVAKALSTNPTLVLTLTKRSPLPLHE